MKINFLLTVAFFLLFSANGHSNQNVTVKKKEIPASDWNKVYDFEKQSLPQSALEAVNLIRQKALQTGNSPELLKAMIYKLKFETAIDRDKLPGLIHEMETFSASDDDKTEQAVIYSLLAELYDRYYRSDLYRIGQRAPVPAAEAGTDMETWPAGVFIKRIAGYVERSLEPAEVLQKTNTLAYGDILQAGESSRELRPSLYDFLVHRGIDLLKGISNPDGNNNFTPQILKLYRDLLAFRSREKNAFALLTVDLDRLDFILNNETEEDDGNKGEEYLAALDRLEKQYAAEDFCAEILYRKAIYYYNNELKKQAYEICLEGIEKYPDYGRTGLLKNFLRQITQSELTATVNNTVYPGEEAPLKIKYRNLDSLTVQIYRINAPVAVYTGKWNRSGQYKKNGQLILTKQITLAGEAPYLYSDTVIKIPMEALGNYEYVIFPDGHPEHISNQQFSVSRLATVARVTDGKREFMVTDLLSGKPVEGGSILLYKSSNNRPVKVQTLCTDANGLASGGKEKDITGYQATYKTDTSLIISSVPWISNDNVSESIRRLNLFTDRSIYRPGQTVYFKGIACETKEVQVIPNDVFTVSLYDANGKNISAMQVKTNEWGSFAGEFVLPQGTLNGRFSIRTDKIAGYAYFHVEEYKRPAFDIRFEKNENTCRFGDKVTVKGSAETFSGVSIQNAKAGYRITRSYHWFFRIWAPPVQVASGDVFLDGQGKFEIGFTPEKAFKDKDRKNVSYTYTVSVNITDAKGETQNAETQINMGDIPFILNVGGLPDAINQDSLSTVTVEATDLSHNPVAVTGSYRIFSLKPKEAGRLDNETDGWLQDKLITEGHFESGKAIPVGRLKSLVSGQYRMIAEAKEAEAFSTDFTVYTDKDKCPPAPVYEWLLPVKTECAAGENAVIIYGSSAKEVYVLYEIFKDRDNKKVAVSRFVLNSENRKIEIPFRESYGDGVSVQFTFIKDAKVFSKRVAVLRKQASRKLDLAMEVFRDRLLPGQKEEWKISVKDAGQKGVAGELLAAMYDASLDKIYRHDWSFNPVRNPRLPDVRTENGDGLSGSSLYFRIDFRPVNIPDFKFDNIDWFGFTVPSRETGIRAFATKNAVMETALAGDLHEIRKKTPQEEAPVQIRRNFNETAFFYPQLMTGEVGETLIAFTVPESNTTWKFMGLAHTKDLKFGQIVKEAISRKKLMVAPNVPRFIREGDRATVSATVSNLSESALSGEVGIEFFDPVSGQTTIAVSEAARPFTVEAGKTVAVSWTFDVPSGIDLTAVKTVAKTAGFSDGEQHLIPVLPNRILVTESLPLDIPGGQTKTVSFDRMKNNSATLQNYRLTLEFTGNPVWYAVQALPSLTAPQSDDALSWFGAYYANATAARIAKSTPKIKQVIEAWALHATSLQSNLEKNQELKTVLLEETPWVTDAKNETEMKQKLSLLFDANRTDYLHSQALDKLRSLQTEDGGWVWFKGMTPSVSITQWILYGLKEAGETGAGEMQETAIRFIDRELKRHYDDYKKYAKPGELQYPATYELEYLLVRSLYKDIPLGETEEAAGFYASITEKNWAGIPCPYGRAIAALFLQRSGKTDIALSIVQSLREHATRKPDLGMYWANSRAGSFFFNNAVAIHGFIMKAFYELQIGGSQTGASTGEMDEMKLWLLKQKQTQETAFGASQWESLPGLVGAIQILLQTGSDWLEDTGKTRIQLGNRSFDTSGGEAGTGYIKEVFDAKTITPDMSRVKITRETAAPGWGALYWQYFEDLDRIKAAKTGLNVEKALFIEKMTGTELKTGGSQTTLSPVTEATPLKVGDKAVVRLIVRADRDFEYVLLKDMRASCFEPVRQLSGVRRAQGAVYYQSPKDASMNYYFHNLPKGTYVFEYPLYVTNEGNYSNGITTVQCLYAPEFVSHASDGIRYTVKGAR
ncbi:MAG: hypothetical protein LBG45_01005 [Dysgonamonadaceae bacterium]|jgi:uncharacterized protein YfaS (alpha-2-macroglobulin family)|nr:hypothetical protein [Dysgonamonadaceae bacterium]